MDILGPRGGEGPRKTIWGYGWNVNVCNDYNTIRTQGINMDQYYLCGVCLIQSLQHNVDPSSNKYQNEDRVFCLAMDKMKVGSLLHNLKIKSFYQKACF